MRAIYSVAKVNLGVIEANPASTPGAITIMEHLHTFVPSDNRGIHPIHCYGGGMSVERMVDAKGARAGGETSMNRLEKLIQCSQEFHKRGLLLKVLFTYGIK